MIQADAVIRAFVLLDGMLLFVVLLPSAIGVVTEAWRALEVHGHRWRVRRYAAPAGQPKVPA